MNQDPYVELLSRLFVYSPAAEAVLVEEPTTGLASTREITQEAPTVNAPTASYALFHYALLVYIYLFCTRLPELIPQIRAALAMSVIMLAGLMATGKGGDLFRTKLGRILTAFTVWTAICVPFSVWVGGSTETLKGTVQAVLFVACIIAFARTLGSKTACLPSAPQWNGCGVIASPCSATLQPMPLAATHSA